MCIAWIGDMHCCGHLGWDKGTAYVKLIRREWMNMDIGFLQDAIEAAIKKAILSPDYMVPAWKVS